MTGRTYVSIAAVAFVAFAVVEMAAQLNAQPASLLQFHSSIQRYVQLHRHNGRFPWRRGAAMWPCVLDALPQLPYELQYRLIGRDLVLVDTHADLVVDILRNIVR
jgi:hypothetical protein